MSELRTGADISNEEFLAAYNNAQLTNQQVIETLNTSWEVVRKKVRSKIIQEQLTVERTGGAKGTHKVIGAATAEPQPTTSTRTAPQVDTSTVESTNEEPAKTTDVDAEVGTTSTSTTSTDDVYNDDTNSFNFQFTALISGQEFEFGGDTKKEALRKFLIECQELKMKNIIIRDDLTGEEVSIKEIENDGVYRVTDQQSAA